VSRKTQLLLLALLCLWAAVMLWLPRVDYRWTAQLTPRRHHPLAVLARRTLFQGQLPGATDPAALFALATVWLYVRANSNGASRRLVAARPVLGYLLVSALFAGFAVVHAAKLVLGRARPLDVLSRQHLPYTEWYQTGKRYLAGGLFRGSFPSGHTAAVFALLALAYALAFDPAAGRRQRAAGAAVAAFSLAAAGVMTVANAMGGNHWLSDGVGAIGLVWLIVHLLYFPVLDVPGQRRSLREALARGEDPPLPRFWEARLCGSGLLALAGAALLALGLRAFAVQRPPTLAWLLLPGAALLLAGWSRARARIAELHRADSSRRPAMPAMPAMGVAAAGEPARAEPPGGPSGAGVSAQGTASGEIGGASG
jgi:membrane-associated phospholipid phosphatase